MEEKKQKRKIGKWDGKEGVLQCLSGTGREDFTKIIIFESKRQRRLFGCVLVSALLGPAQKSLWGRVRGGEDEMKIR